MSLIKEISETSPNAWKDFLNFYSNTTEEFPEVKNVPFDKLPFLMQVGLLVGYLQENGIEPDLANFHLNDLEMVLQEAFVIQESNLSHYS
ncbi:hypothetical protein RCC89_14750 [Cytophagaceae bacterium ABcell3]|nr:hypothetical protein RCC89_14750 [Cytophagaceae bacterium ABcell3]